jgi:hypothetical protein
MVENFENCMRYSGAYSAEKPRDDYFGSGRKIQEAIKEIGRDCFTKQEFEVETFEDRQILELHFMTLYDTIWPNGYNLHRVSSRGSFDYIPSQEQRENQSKMMSELIHTSLYDNFRGSKGMLGKRQSNYQKQKAKEVNVGIPKTKEQKRKNSESNKKHWENGYPEWVNKGNSEETRIKISKKRQLTPEITCIYCNKSCSPSTHSRFHGDNCLKNPNLTPKQIQQLRNDRVWKKMVCEYCGKKISISGYSQYHGEKCKLSPKNIKNVCS